MRRRIVFFGIALLCAAAARAGHLELASRWCSELVVPRIDLERIHIPVGCEVIDCCPGCPGPPIDWHILVRGNPVQAVTLTFDHLTAVQRRGLKIEGNAKWSGESTLTVGAGSAIVRGFPAQADDPPVASAKIALAGKEGSKPMAIADTPPKGDVQLDVRQQIGAILVNRTLARYVWFPCGGVYTVTDRLRIDNNAGGDDSLALLDARRSAGCANDEPQHLTTVRDVGSVLSNGGCNSEVAVFSTDDAFQLATSVSSWHDPLGDLTPVDLSPDALNTPLSVWVMRGTFANTSTRVNNDRARASQLYNSEQVGTTVSLAATHDATADPDTAGLLNSDCGGAANLRSRIGFDAGRLNIYYLDDPGARGWWCGTNTIIVGSGADNESLAHEIGHAFSLGHTNGIAGIPNTNLMITGGTGRDSITKGQAFRCNLNPGSTLNTNGTRTGVTRSCPDATTSATCPALSLDP